MRKKKIWIGLLCCILTAATGCQNADKTEGIVMEKTAAGTENTVEMQESEAQITYKTEETEANKALGESASALAEQLGISGRWIEEIDLGNGNSITADAEILLPDTEKFPVYEVNNPTWKPEFVQQMGDALLGGETSWYDLGTYFSTAKEKREELEAVTPEWDLEELAGGISDSDHVVPTKDSNHVVKTKNGELYAAWAREEKWDNHEFYIQYLYGNDGFASKSRNYEWHFDTSEEKRKQVEDNCGLTEEEAISHAEKCLQNFPVSDFHVTGTAYAVRNGRFAGDGIEDAAYFIACEREVEKIPITFDYACGGAFEDMNAENPLWWNNELLFLIVNDKGVVAAEAYNFYDIGEKTEENVTLLPFSEICDVFEAEKRAEAQMSNLKQMYRVNKIRLGYFRVYEPENGSLIGKLIPVWDFYGNWTQQMEEQEPFESDCSYTSICTINAMDGSVIRRSVGY